MSLTSLQPSEQELSAIRAIALYGTIRAAAAALRLSPHTVDAHLDHLRNKCGYRHLPQLVALAAERGWLAGRLRHGVFRTRIRVRVRGKK